MDLTSFDFSQYMVAGIALLPVALGLVQFVKELFKLEGRAARLLAFFTPFGLVLLWEVRAFLPPIYETVYVMVLTATTGALSSMGLYQLATGLVDRNREKYVVEDGAPQGLEDFKAG